MSNESVTAKTPHEIIIQTIANSKINFIPVNIDPYPCRNFIVLHKDDLIQSLRSKQWTYRLITIDDGETTHVLWVESKNPLYEEYKILEVYLPVDEVCSLLGNPILNPCKCGVKEMCCNGECCHY